MFWRRDLVSAEMAEWVREGFALLIRDMGPTQFLQFVTNVEPVGLLQLDLNLAENY